MAMLASSRAKELVMPLAAGGCGRAYPEYPVSIRGRVLLKCRSGSMRCVSESTGPDGAASTGVWGEGRDIMSLSWKAGNPEGAFPCDIEGTLFQGSSVAVLYPRTSDNWQP